jgi:hypothetical protein
MSLRCQGRPREVHIALCPIAELGQRTGGPLFAGIAPEPLVEPDGHGLAELAGLVDAGELTVPQ